MTRFALFIALLLTACAPQQRDGIVFNGDYLCFVFRDKHDNSEPVCFTEDKMMALYDSVARKTCK